MRPYGMRETEGRRGKWDEGGNERRSLGLRKEGEGVTKVLGGEQCEDEGGNKKHNK